MQDIIRIKKVVCMDEMFSLREGLNLEMSKLSWIRSSILEEEWQDEIMEKSLGEMVWWEMVCMLEREAIVSFNENISSTPLSLF